MSDRPSVSSAANKPGWAKRELDRVAVEVRKPISSLMPPVSTAASYRDARGAVPFSKPRHIYRLAVWLGGKLQDLGYAVYLWGWRDRG